MRVTKQLSEDEFVVKMDEADLNENDSVLVAHDYVMFSANQGYMVDTKLDFKPYGKYAGAASNWIKGRHQVQIGIRDMIAIVLPLLNKEPNCQPEHLVQDGKPVYTFNSSNLIFYEDGVKKIALRKMGDDKYTIMDYETYKAIKNGEI